MSKQFLERAASRANAESASKAGLGFGEGTVFESLLHPAICYTSDCHELRPVPGSRVNLIPANTQGAGVPIFGAPVKGKIHQQRRIQYPPSALIFNVDNSLWRSVTKL